MAKPDYLLPTDKCGTCKHEFNDHQNSANMNTLCQKCTCDKFWLRNNETDDLGDLREVTITLYKDGRYDEMTRETIDGSQIISIMIGNDQP